MQREGKVSGRRKSSVAFSPALKKYEPVDNVMQTLDNESREWKPFQLSSSRLSVFSRFSDVSFHRLNTKSKCIYILLLLMMVFFIGVAVGAMSAKSFLCTNSVELQVIIE